MTVPTWRARDVTREIDVVEEVARFRLDDVPGRLPQRQAMFGRLTKLQRARRRIEDTLVGFGYSEAYTWSLLPERSDARRASSCRNRCRASRRSCARSLVEGLLASARRNVDAGNAEIALFELAHVYLPTGDKLPDEHWHVGGIADGGLAFAKGTVEGLYEALGVDAVFEPADELPVPGRGARTPEGWVASVRDPDLPGDWGAFELDVDALVERIPDVDRVRRRHHLSTRASGPRVHRRGGRDGRRSRRRQRREAAGPALREMRAFDVYRGEQVGPGPQVDRLLCHVPGAGPDAHGRGRRRASEPHRRRTGRALRRAVAGLRAS